jgi:hypothetical protein
MLVGKGVSRFELQQFVAQISCVGKELPKKTLKSI